MSSRRSLFREEAVAHHARGVGQGGPVRLGRRWTGLGFLALLVLVALAVLSAALIRINPSISGPAAVAGDGQSIVAVLPVSAVSPVRQGREVELDAGGRTITLPASAVRIEVVDRPSAARALRRGLEDLPGDELAVLRARVAPIRTADGDPPTVRVALPGKRLLSVLLTGFDDAGG